MSRDKIQNSEQEGLTPSTGGLTSLGGSPTDSLKERGLTHAAGGARPGSSTLGRSLPLRLCTPAIELATVHTGTHAGLSIGG